MYKMEQIERFFLTTLNFSSWKELLNKDKLEFINVFVQKMQHHSYFHNIIMSSTKPSDRKPPTMEESWTLISEGHGGVCIDQNGVAGSLLKALGFDAYLCAGNVLGSSASAEGNHCMCIVKLSDTEIFLIDVGCALPIDGPIPLHSLPYQGISAGFRYEYRFNADKNVYERWQLDGTYFNGPFEDESKNHVRYQFTIRPKESSYFQETLIDVFTNPTISIFLKCPFLFRCLVESDKQMENGRPYILIFGASMVIYDNVNRQVTDFTSYLEMKEAISKHFPNIDPSRIQQALEYFESHNAPLVCGRS